MDKDAQHDRSFSPRDTLFQENTPLWGFVLAVLAGIFVPLMCLLPLFLILTFAHPTPDGITTIFLLTLFLGVPLFY